MGFIILFFLIIAILYYVFSRIIVIGRKNYIFLSRKEKKFMCCPSQRVNVFKYEEVVDKKGRVRYKPIFKYTYDGMDFYIKGYDLRKKKEFFEVIIKVNSKNPSEAVIWARGDFSNILCAIVVIISILFIIIFLGSYFLYA